MRGRGPLAGALELAEAQSRVLSLPEVVGARSVCAYAAVGDEIPTDGILSALWCRGVAVALPRVQGPGLLLCYVSERTPLVPGPLGVREPPLEAAPLDLEAIDVFLVPGVLFDRWGRRLGRGGGHFDRMLARARRGAVCVGLCHASRVVEELPEDPWDVRMHLVVTTLEVIAAPGVRSR